MGYPYERTRKIVLMGLPGSGKSSMGKILSIEWDIPLISSGDIARTMDTPPGEMADETAMRTQIKDALVRCARAGFILDGFPRFTEQAIWLNKQVGAFDIFNLAIDPMVAARRLLARGRKDDTSDIIENRIARYRKMTLPMMTDVWDGVVDAQPYIIRVGGLSPYQTAQRVYSLSTEYPSRR